VLCSRQRGSLHFYRFTLKSTSSKLLTSNVVIGSLKNLIVFLAFSHRRMLLYDAMVAM
jgi:hypothetical protein